MAEQFEFSPNFMSLAQHKAASEQMVHFNGRISMRSKSNSLQQKRLLHLSRIWSTLDSGQNTGQNSLVKLAVYLFSVVSNSAGAERTFSQMGLIHTKIRNRLSAEKVHKIVSLKMDLNRMLDKEDTGEHRRKRKFREDEPINEQAIEDYRVAPHSPDSQAALRSGLHPLAEPTCGIDQSSPLLTSQLPSEASVEHETPPEGVSATDDATNALVLPHADPETFSDIVKQMIIETNEDSAHLFTSLTSESRAHVDPHESSSQQASFIPENGSSGNTIQFNDAYLLRNIFDFAAVDILDFDWPHGIHCLDTEGGMYELVHENLDEAMQK